jgi:glycosyltransferase involved in cell wall biosynthesis
LKKNWRENCYLQFFYHGYPPFLVNFIGNAFYEALNEHVVLTYDSYIAHQQHYTVLPCAFSVLHNGIDTTQFYPVSATVKANLRSQFNVANQTLVFIWCSQDRPKKGLDFILNVWKLLTPQYPTIELWVIGTTRTINQPQVKVFGRIPNNELPKFYQAADFFLFPSLCHEGFGLSLVEAFKCGCYCIASKNGGIPEVLNYGAYGRLVEHPNIINNWVQTIKSSITAYENAHKTHQFLKNAPTEIYSIEQWSTGMNTIISNAKVLLK